MATLQRSFDVSKLMADRLTLTIRLTGLVRYRMRAWLGLALLRLACTILPMRTEIIEGGTENTESA